MPTSPRQLIIFGVIAIAVIALMAFRLRRMMRSTPYNVQYAWVAPAIFVAFFALTWWRTPPMGMEYVWLLFSVIIGGGLGWLRGSSIKMNIDPATGRLMAQGSATAILFLLGLLVVRTGLRYVLANNAASLGIRADVVDVLATGMALGLFAIRSVEMSMRGSKLLAAARNAPTAPITDAP